MATSFPLACHRILRAASRLNPRRVVCSLGTADHRNEVSISFNTYISTRQYFCLKPYVVAGSKGPCFQDQVRWKSKKGKAKAELEEEEEEEDEEETGADEDETVPGDHEISCFVSSTRIDSILKAGIQLSKTKAAESFYAGSIRVNGTKPHKKAMQIDIGDEVDYIIGFLPENPNLMTVHRITLLRVVNDKITDKGRFEVVLRRQKNLVIEKYEDYEG